MENLRCTLFVPVLNEIDGLKAIMPTIPKEWFEQILVVDGKSTDGSAEWAKEQGYDVHVQEKKGIRHAYIEAWSKIKNPYVITFSPDGNCKVEDLPLIFRELVSGRDMVIASRYYGNAHSDDDSWLTGFGNWLFTSFINLFHGGNYSDAMTIYRGYRTPIFYELDLDKEVSYTPEKWFGTVMGIEPLLSIRAAKAKLDCSDVPSDEPPRLYGKRKLQIFRWGAAYMSQVFREVVFWNVRTRQLKAAKTA